MWPFLTSLLTGRLLEEVERLMFAINGAEALLAALWLIGVVCAVANLARGRRGPSGVALLAAAIVVPVLGSLLAVAVFVMHMRGTADRADPPVAR